MRRTLLSCAGAALLLAPLAACGDDDDTTSPPTSASDTGGTDDGASTDAATLTVGARNDLTFDAESYEVAAGDIHVVYENLGSVPHTLLIDGVDDFKLSVGDTDEGDVTLEPGTYRLYCDVAGHEAAGMVAELTVAG